MSMNPDRLKSIVEGAIMAAGRPLSIDQLLSLFLDEEQPSRDEIRTALDALRESSAERGVELTEVASGFRFQVKAEYAEWVSRLWDERPTRYSRAVLETLSLIAYRQPITRGEIEDIRGVSVSSNIVKSLMEREWIKIVGHRDVPGKPALFATTRQFLDYFNLKGLSDLPPLAEIRSIESIEQELDFGDLAKAKAADGEAVDAGVEGEAKAELGADTDAEGNLAHERIEIPELALADGRTAEQMSDEAVASQRELSQHVDITEEVAEQGERATSIDVAPDQEEQPSSETKVSEQASLDEAESDDGDTSSQQPASLH